MAKKLKLPKNWIIWLVGIFFIMSVMPGEGTKAEDNQAIVATEYLCSTVDDCPKCTGGGLIEFNETAEEHGFFEELSFSDCVNGKCELSDACIVWDCPEGAELETDDGPVPCESVKQTLLDNTIGRFNENPVMFLLIIGLIVAYFML